MTIATTVNKVTGQGNGATTAFSFSFLIPAASNAVATFVDAFGVQTVLQPTQYSISGIGNPNGGTINYPLSGGPMSVGQSVTLQRVLPYQQLTSLVNQSGYYPAVVEAALDNIEMQIQQIAASTGGNTSLQFPAVDPVTLNATLPAAAARANNLLSFDSLGNVTTVAPAAQSATALSTSLLTSAGATLVNWIQSGTSAVIRFIQDKLREKVSVLDFMTTAQIADYQARTLTLDLTAPIQAAINSLVNGDELDLCNGDAKITAALTVNVSGITVSGRGYNSRIITNHATADIFTVGNTGGTTTGVLFKNFRVWSSVTKSAGYAFNCRQMTNTRFENVYAGALNDYVANGSAHRLWDGYYFDRFGENAVMGGEIVVATTAIKARGNAGQTFGAELSIGGACRVFGAGKGLWLGGAAGGVYCGRVDFSQCGYGIYCDTTLQAANNNRELFLNSDCTLDSGTNWAINVEDSGLAFLEASGTWISGNGAAGIGGIRVAPTTGTVLSAKWSGIRLKNNVGDGAQFSQGNHVFTGGYCSNNGSSGAGANGINAAAFTSLTVTGMQIDNNGNATAGSGIVIGGGQNTYNIQANNFFTNGLGGTKHVTDTSGVSDTTHVIRNNNGYVTENNGVATVANTATSVVVNHGLSGTPSNAVVSWGGTPDAALLYCSAADFTATQLTIRTSAAVSANRTVSWRAMKGAQ